VPCVCRPGAPAAMCASPRSVGDHATAGPNVDLMPPELDSTSMADKSDAAELARQQWAVATSS
jgi:hypothetical protein